MGLEPGLQKEEDAEAPKNKQKRKSGESFETGIIPGQMDLHRDVLCFIAGSRFLEATKYEIGYRISLGLSDSTSVLGA